MFMLFTRDELYKASKKISELATGNKTMLFLMIRVYKNTNFPIIF